jgi:hypothetical protein
MKANLIFSVLAVFLATLHFFRVPTATNAVSAGLALTDFLERISGNEGQSQSKPVAGNEHLERRIRELESKMPDATNNQSFVAPQRKPLPLEPEPYNQSFVAPQRKPLPLEPEPYVAPEPEPYVAPEPEPYVAPEPEPTKSFALPRNGDIFHLHVNGRPCEVWSDGIVALSADEANRIATCQPNSPLYFPNSLTIHASPRSRQATTIYLRYTDH